MSADFTPEKEDLKILTPFKMQVLTNFPYIEADFDALTNYQLLCKIVEYLNNVITNENEVTEQVISLYNAYVALQNYVNTYFDNLDLQEIVDNKLDEMAESGVLADMIAEYIKMQGQLVYNSVEDMKAADNIQNGSFLKTYGYYNYQDGGGALYKARTVTNDDIIDNKFIIALSDNTLVAELIYNGVLNIKQIGAKSIENFDNSTIINYAISKLNIKELLFIDNGTYEVHDTININKQLNIKCIGVIKSIETSPCILITADHCNIDINEIRESQQLTLDVTSDKYLINAGIVIKDSKFANLDINTIINFNVGCLLYSTTDTHYNNIKIRTINTCFYGYEIISHNGGSANGNIFTNTIFDYHTWDTDITPYFIINKSYGDNPYKNNSNIFKGMMAEYGISATGGPKLLYLEHTHSNIFEFDRVEIASTSGSDPLTINNTNSSNNYIILNYAAQNFTFDNNNGSNNVVRVLSGYGSSNLSNNIKDITSSLTLANGVTIYTGGVWVDYINRICYINVLIRNIADIQPGEDVLSGLPVPKEHVRIYTMSTNGNNPDARPADLQNLLISKSISRGALQTIVQLAFGRSTAINICYKF